MQSSPLICKEDDSAQSLSPVENVFACVTFYSGSSIFNRQKCRFLQQVLVVCITRKMKGGGDIASAKQVMYSAACSFNSCVKHCSNANSHFYAFAIFFRDKFHLASLILRRLGGQTQYRRFDKMATSKGANTYNRQNWEDSVKFHRLCVVIAVFALL